MNVYDYTWGELIEFSNSYYERKRREYKNLSIIAHTQAILTAAKVANKSFETEEVFPFWTEEEKNKIKVEKYTNIMWRYVSSTNINK